VDEASRHGPTKIVGKGYMAISVPRAVPRCQEKKGVHALHTILKIHLMRFVRSGLRDYYSIYP
jgi:hypothetical protein